MGFRVGFRFDGMIRIIFKNASGFSGGGVRRVLTCLFVRVAIL